MLAGLAAAGAAGLGPVKVNAVLDPGSGLADAVELLRFCLRYGYQLRIIEQMPLDAGHQWRRDATLRADDILTALGEHFTLSADPAPGSAPAQLWQVDGGPATVGIIASVSHAFCAACDRTRLTADGQVRSCLFATEETDLRGRCWGRRRRRCAGDGVAHRNVAQGRRARDQRPGLHPAATTDECDRWLIRWRHPPGPK